MIFCQCREQDDKAWMEQIACRLAQVPRNTSAGRSCWKGVTWQGRSGSAQDVRVVAARFSRDCIILYARMKFEGEPNQRVARTTPRPRAVGCHSYYCACLRQAIGRAGRMDGC